MQPMKPAQASPIQAFGRQARSWRLSSLFVACALFACEAPKADATPEGVVMEFVERMRRVHGDPQAAKAAYDLLWLDAKGNLAERAKRASAVAGRPVAPEEMLAPSRFALAFRPKRYTSRIEGRWAVVVVTGDAPATEKKEVRVTLEEDGWRIALEVPALPPIRKRDGQAQPKAR
jgi:hypothetical protein